MYLLFMYMSNYFFKMSKNKSIDIDTKADLKIAKKLLNNK